MSTMATVMPGTDPPPDSRTDGTGASLRRIFKPLASLRLTVVLLALSMALVFVGTIAQVDDSIHTVLNKYFYTWLAWVPFDIFVRFGQKFLGVSNDFHIGGNLPFPGGWTLGVALMINLLAAHSVRLKLNLRKPGVWLIHAGIVILLLGEFLSSQCKIESRMSIAEGRQSNWVENYHRVELAIVDSSDPKEDQVFVAPEEILQRGGRISDPALPVDVDVVKYIPVSNLTDDLPAENPATMGFGLQTGAAALHETAGISTTPTEDIPAAYVRFLSRDGGKDLGTYLLTPWIMKSQVLHAGDKKYAIALRLRRQYLPFTLQLNKFRFDRFIGTSIARNYSSDVRLIDQDRHEDRPVHIAMNEPLRYRGETFYQADFDHATEKSTVLQVVRNPAWTTPYIACSLVVLGMLVHFGMHLAKFVQKRTAL